MQNGYGQRKRVPMIAIVVLAVLMTGAFAAALALVGYFLFR
jgi:hypothetical protein